MVHPRPAGRALTATRPTRRVLARSHGQGTVEYVALILLVAGVLAGVITAAGGLKGGGIAQSVVAKMKQTIEHVGEDRR